MKDDPIKTSQLTRRKFNHGGIAALLAAGVAPTIQTAQGQDEPKRKLGFAVMGLGGFWDKTISQELPFMKGAELRGVVTGDPSGKGKAAAEKYGFPEANVLTYEEISKLADIDEIDYVHVVTPNGLHAQHSIAAAEAGKHVICEKPMARTPEECQSIIDACEKNDVLLAVHYRLHFEPHHAALIKACREETYGKVLSVHGAANAGRAIEEKAWLSDPELAGGGAMMDIGVYPLQAGCYCTGETPIAVSARTRTTIPGLPEEIEETIYATYECPGGKDFTVVATYGFMASDFVVSTDQFFNLSVGVDPQVKNAGHFGQSAFGRPSSKYLIIDERGAKRKIEQFDKTFQVAVFHDEFAQAIRDGKREFLTDGAMGKRDVALIRAAYESAKKGGARVEIAI